MTGSFRALLATTILQALPMALLAQITDTPVDTPGITTPLTARQIARAYPPDALREGGLRGLQDTDGTLPRLEPPSLLSTAEGPVLPDAPGKDLVLTHCTRCHAIDLVVAQPRRPEEWMEVVSIMVGNGMALTDAQYTGILTYLSDHLSTNAAGPH